MPFRKCSRDHSFVQVYPIPEEAKDVAARFVDMKNMIEDNEGVRQLDWAVDGASRANAQTRTEV